MKILSFSAIGYRDIDGRFSRRTEELVRRRRDAVREAGQVYVEALKRHAPERSGIFKEGIAFQSYERGSHVLATVFVGGEHAYVLPFLKYGTKPHTIPTGGAAAQMAKGYPLRFFWEKGPRGPGIYYYWETHHPGTDPDPFIEDAQADAKDDVSEIVGRTARQVAWL